MSQSFAKIQVEPAAFTVPQVARYLGTSPASIYRWFKNGTLRKAKIGGQTLVRRVDADALLARAAGITADALFD